MHTRSLFNACWLGATIVTLGCGHSMATEPTQREVAASRLFQVSGPTGAVWADGELFAIVAPPATFDNPHGNFDQLYKGGNGFLNGVGAISDAKPGDQDYNGGRWHVQILKAGVDPDKYADASSAEDLDPADFDSTDVYFECPMIPRRGAGVR
jgi:hypothetical protein